MNPGSREALDRGCKCPVLDNNHGAGIGKDPDGETMFWINDECPLHGSNKENMFMCTKCGFASMDKDKLREHTLFAHDLEIPDTMITCMVCGKYHSIYGICEEEK